MVSLSALVQRFSRDGTAPTGVRKHVGVSEAVTMTVSKVRGTSYTKHPVPDRQTTPMPAVSPLRSTLATTPESFLEKHHHRHSFSVHLHLSFEHQCGNSFHYRKMKKDYYYSQPRPKFTWSCGLRNGWAWPRVPAAVLTLPLKTVLCRPVPFAGSPPPHELSENKVTRQWTVLSGMKTSILHIFTVPLQTLTWCWYFPSFLFDGKVQNQ